MIELSATDARRAVLRAQLLTDERPTDLHAVIDRLCVVQNDPTKAIAPSADLVLWSRLGRRYDPADLRDAVESQEVLEHHSMLRPPHELTLLRAEMAHWPTDGEPTEWEDELADWVAANDGCRRDILEALRQDGPLPASAFPDTCELPWRSSGWNNDRNVRRLLDLMVARGEVAAAGGVGGRGGRERMWDLAERVHPDEPVPPLDEARRELARRRLRSLGVAREREAVRPGEPYDVGTDAGEPATIEGVRGRWRVDPEALDTAFAPRTALLSPFDRTISNRKRAEDLFGFDYVLEMFKPAAQRRFGYYALPILHGDRFVGKLDAALVREDGVLLVHAVHEDEPFDAATRDAVEGEIADLAAWLGVKVERAPA